jgi:hypothetical protein
MFDLSALPFVLTASDRMYRSAMPGAPVVPTRPPRRRRRGFTGRLRAVQLEKE